jgi:hypothetical protein
MHFLKCVVCFLRSIGQGAFGEVFHGFMTSEPDDTVQEIPIAAKVRKHSIIKLRR